MTIEMTRSSPTLQAVADAAGVHRSTASRALNPQTAHLVAPDSVVRVQAAAKALGYRRDILAAGLRTKRSRLVGVVVPDLANPVFAPILSGIEAVLSANGYSVLTANAGSDPERQTAIVDQLIAHRVEGLVLATVRRDDPVLTRCLEAGVPAVLVNRAEDGERVPAVVPDDIGGMRLSVDHLIALGHRRIGHLGGPGHLSTGSLRRRGFEEAMRAAGLDADAVVAAEAYSRPAGQAATAALLDRFPVTAIAAANDLLALGALQEFRRRGWACPADISIVGHNDMDLVDMVDPPLTTVRICHTEMGEEAARLLLLNVAERGRRPVTRVTPASLVVRASTAAPVSDHGRTAGDSTAKPPARSIR